MCSQTASRRIGRLPKPDQDIDKELQGEHVCWCYVMTYVLCVSTIKSTMYPILYQFFNSFFMHIVKMTYFFIPDIERSSSK